MRNYLFRWSGILIVMTIAIALITACQSQNSEGEAQENNNKNEESSDEDNEVQELSIFIDQDYWPLDEWKGKIPEEITERTGIKLDVQVAADDQQLPLMISSGDLPDLVFTTNNFEEMSDSELSYTWDELIEEYEIEDFDIDPTARVLNETDDEELFSVKNGYTDPDKFQETEAAIGNVPAFSVRPDIMEELGDPELETLDDLVDILKEVKESYPDMTPLVMDPAAIGQYFRVNFGVAFQGFIDVNGKVKYYIDDPKQYDYYMFMNKLFREGLISSENFAWDGDEAKGEILSGKAFSINSTEDPPAINSEIESAGGDFEIEQVTNLLGEDSAIVTSNAGWSGLFITKNTDKPEVAMDFLDFMYSEEGERLGSWGIEDDDYTMDKPLEEGGYPEFNYDADDATEQKERGAVWWGLLADDGIVEAVQRYQPGKRTTEAMINGKKHMDTDSLLGAIEPRKGSEELNIKTELDEMVQNEEAKIYLAESEEEAKEAYENMIQTAEEIGISELNDYANNKYEELEDRVQEVEEAED